MGKELIRWRAALSSLTEGKSIDNEEYLSQFRTYMNKIYFPKYAQFNLN